ncbi:hypothetical protein C8F04DRAFT_325644 [Mycena alexandri]|uniref:Uncharacterized protein n=1 Tax=Mycena alexandri TaxID=1745969 RepID=A0AAD6WP34_9AGAR|nr:hypothetical protein C8F04DRAFT_325644 [Mycena alexandri]
MVNAVNLAAKPCPWPWQQPSILTAVEDERRPVNSWLDVDLGKGDDSDSSDYDPAKGSGSDCESTNDSDEAMDDSSSLSESEIGYVVTAGNTGWPPRSPTESEKARDKMDDLILSIPQLLEAESAAAAAYNPDEIVSLITQFYELLIAMGHWPEGSLRYAPHTNPPVNEGLAVQLGYAPAVISLMKRLPYLSSEANQRHCNPILARTVLADYTRDVDLKEGRRPYPYMYDENCPNLDPWLLLWVLPGRDGSHVILDTTLGAIRAYCVDGFIMREDTVEWQRHGKVHWEEAALTEYRRAPFVLAAGYFTELIYAYRSLSRLP